MTTAAEQIVRWLVNQGVHHVFLVPGAHIDPLVVELEKASESILPVYCASELGAAYAADGYARANRNLGVVLVNGGPGCHNLTTGIKTALLEQSPLLVISGNVPVDLQGKGGFQDASLSGAADIPLMESLVSSSTVIENPEQLTHALPRAVSEAQTIPVGPVHLQIPHHILTSPMETPIEVEPAKWQTSRWDGSALSRALTDDAKTVLLIGNSRYLQTHSARLTEMIERINIPVVCSFAGRGAISDDHHQYFGSIGFGSSSSGRRFISDSNPDRIVTLDFAWNERNTVAWDQSVWREIELLHFHPRGNQNRHPHESFELNFEHIEKILDSVPSLRQDVHNARGGWLGKQTRFSGNSPTISRSSDEFIDGAELVQTLLEVTPSKAAMVVDAGMIRLLAGAYWRVREPATFFTSDIVASMGWGISAAIGVALSKCSTVVALTGDGSMLMQGMELTVARELNLPVKYILLDNGGYASIDLRMRRKLKDPLYRTPIRMPDWVQFGSALGIPVFKPSSTHDLKEALTACMEHEGPGLAIIPSSANPVIGDDIDFFSAFA